MAMSRQERIGVHTNQKRMQSSNSMPSVHEITEGKPVFRETHKGLYQYVKFRGEVYSQLMTKHTKSLEQEINDTVKNITIEEITLSGTLDVSSGGTGATTLTQNGVLIGNATSAVSAVDLSTDGVIVIGDGSGNPTTLDVGGSGGITILGTIATGVWQGTDVGVAYGGTGVSTLTSNAILTGNGASAIQAESDLLFASNVVYPTATAHNAAGKALTVSAGDTTAGTTNNIAGGALTFEGGIGKGSGAGGDIIFKTANAGSSGSSLNSLATALTISDDLSATFPGVLNASIGVNLATASGITTVGSSNALTVSAAGVLTVNNTTAASSSTSGSVIIDGGVGVAGILWTGSDVVVGDDLLVTDDVSLTTDASIFRMGDGGDFSITHDGGTGATVTSSGALVVDATASTLTLDGHSGVTLQTGTASADITLNSGDDIHLLPTGYVGINDTTPESLLHMKGANPVLTIQDTETGAADADARIRLAESDGPGAVENYWDIHNSGVNLLLTRNDGTGNVVIRSCYVDDFAINIKPEANGRHYASGTADLQNNYSMMGIHFESAAYNTGYGT